MADDSKQSLTSVFYSIIGRLIGIGFAIGVVLAGIVGFVVWLILP